MGNSPKTLYLCGVEWLQEKCNHMNFFETFVTKEGEKVTHREIRQVMACICNDFYSRIKDMDGTQEDWAEISKIAEEYRSRCSNSRFAKDMMLAIMDELERTWEGSHKKKGAD